MTDLILQNGGKSEIQRAIDAIESTPGGSSDPLLLDQYVAIGDTPASVGGVRLANDKILAWRNLADDDDLTMGFLSVSLNDIPRDSVRIFDWGNDPTDNQFQMYADESWTEQLFLLNGSGLYVGFGAYSDIFKGDFTADPELNTHAILQSDNLKIVAAGGGFSYIDINSDGGPRIVMQSDVDTHPGSDGFIRLPHGAGITWRNSNDNGNKHLKFGSDVVDTLSLDADMILANLLPTGYVEQPEISDPSAPSANKARIYVRDNGGKTELVALFPTGAVQRLAIEP